MHHEANPHTRFGYLIQTSGVFVYNMSPGPSMLTFNNGLEVANLMSRSQCSSSRCPVCFFQSDDLPVFPGILCFHVSYVNVVFLLLDEV